MRRALLLASFLALAAPGVASAQTALVDVSVATLWKAPNLARPLDAPSLTNPADPRGWSRNLATTADRLWLDSRVQTQALYGQEVVILARRGAWAKVAVVDEPDPQDPRGYPGWVPVSQLALDERLTPGPAAIVTATSAMLRRTGTALEVSFATRLPLIRVVGQRAVVATPRGRASLPLRAVRIVQAAGHPTGAQIVATAQRFLGVHYIWGGLSVFGYDCSGLVWAAYRSFGATIPRDADPQFRVGTTVARNRLRPGDLLFYGTQRYVHHVAIYAGAGRMIEAPGSAYRVRLVPVRWGEFAGARRY